jgi:hypothetical protein
MFGSVLVPSFCRVQLSAKAPLWGLDAYSTQKSRRIQSPLETQLAFQWERCQAMSQHVDSQSMGESAIANTVVA